MKKGSVAWIALAAGVVTWDLLADETLTAAFRRACSHPAGRAAVIAGWAVLTAHLFAALPQRADPFYVVYTAVERMRRRELATLAKEQSHCLAG